MQSVENQSKNILLFTIFVAILLVFTMIYKSSDILNVEAECDEEDETRVAILASDHILDQSWGSLAYKGQLEIEERFPINTTLHSELITDALKEETAVQMIEEGTDLIIGHGREFSETFTSLAENHPNIMFVTIHGTATYENQAVYTFDKGKVEYFAALVAALKTKTKKIGVIRSYEDRELVTQFEEGLQFYAPNVSLLYETVPDRNDGDGAIRAMNNMLDIGVDVIYTKGNGFNQQVIEYAIMKDIYVIGYLEDQSYMAKDHVLTSVTNDIPKVYVAIMDDYFSDEGISSGETSLNNGEVYGLAPLGWMFAEVERKYIYNEMKKYYKEDIVF
jgi:transcriptional activator of comK gene